MLSVTKGARFGFAGEGWNHLPKRLLFWGRGEIVVTSYSTKRVSPLNSGAGDGTRTRDVQLGKLRNTATSTT